MRVMLYIIFHKRCETAQGWAQREGILCSTTLETEQNKFLGL